MGFINTKLADLTILNYDVETIYTQSLDVSNDVAHVLELFSSTMTDVMYRVEGIEHFMVQNLYGFEYLNQ